MAQEKVAELAAHVAGEKDKQLASLAAHVESLEATLSQKEEVGRALTACTHWKACRAPADYAATLERSRRHALRQFVSDVGALYHTAMFRLLLAQELEESRRMYNAQKRALREALAAAAEAEVAERQADEARARTAVAQVRKRPRWSAGPIGLDYGNGICLGSILMLTSTTASPARTIVCIAGSGGRAGTAAAPAGAAAGGWV